MFAIVVPIIFFVCAKQLIFSKEALERAAGPGEGYYWAASQYQYAAQRFYGDVCAYSLNEIKSDKLNLSYNILKSKFFILKSTLSPNLKGSTEINQLLSDADKEMKDLSFVSEKNTNKIVKNKFTRQTMREILPISFKLSSTAHDYETRLRDESIEQILKMRNKVLLVAVMLWIIFIFFLVYGLIIWKKQNAAREVIAKIAENEKINKEEIARIAMAKSSMIATVSHDVLTPLTTIKGTIDLMKEGNVDSMLLKQITMIVSSCEYLEQLMLNILDFERLAAGKLVLRPIKFSPRHLINKLAGEYEEKIKKKGVRFDVTCSSSLLGEVVGDVIRIKQVVNNVLSNAIKYTYVGYIKLNIDQTTTDPFMLVILVEDTGVGISESDKIKLFDSFAQGGKEYRGGFGMGLSIASRLLDLMSGSIELKFTQPGVGSTFLVKIPITLSSH
jgi:signal transduction histidine kinase